jgi:hypothetical protein
LAFVAGTIGPQLDAKSFPFAGLAVPESRVDAVRFADHFLTDELKRF